MRGIVFEKLLYKFRNLRAHFRALLFGASITVGVMTFKSELRAKIVRASGQEVDLGIISRRVVTTAGVNFMRDDFVSGSGTADIHNFNFHDSGTGSNAEAITDVDLQTPAGPATRAAGVQTAPATKQYRSTATIIYPSPTAVTEHGIFSQATRGGLSVLWDRSVFAVINMVAGDAIQFQYTLIVQDGG